MVNMATNDTVSNEEISVSVKIVVCMLSLFSVVGVVGNAIAFYIFCGRRSTSTSVIFILALAGVDFFTCLVTIPYTIYFEVVKYNLVYDAACKMYMFLITSIQPFSAYIMVGIALDRYFCICHPFLYVFTVPRAKAVVLCMAIPALIFGIITALSHGMDAYELSAINSNNTRQVVGEFTDKEEADKYVAISNLTHPLLTFVHYQQCVNNTYIFSKEFLHTYKQFHAMNFVLAYIAVAVLYILIYKSIFTRRVKKAKRKKCNLYPTSSNKTKDNNGEETQMTATNGCSITNPKSLNNQMRKDAKYARKITLTARNDPSVFGHSDPVTKSLSGLSGTGLLSQECSSMSSKYNDCLSNGNLNQSLPCLYQSSKAKGYGGRDLGNTVSYAPMTHAKDAVYVGPVSYELNTVYFGPETSKKDTIYMGPLQSEEDSVYVGPQTCREENAGSKACQEKDTVYTGPQEFQEKDTFYTGPEERQQRDTDYTPLQTHGEENSAYTGSQAHHKDSGVYVFPQKDNTIRTAGTDPQTQPESRGGQEENSPFRGQPSAQESNCISRSPMYTNDGVATTTTSRHEVIKQADQTDFQPTIDKDENPYSVDVDKTVSGQLKNEFNDRSLNTNKNYEDKYEDKYNMDDDSNLPGFCTGGDPPEEKPLLESLLRCPESSRDCHETKSSKQILVGSPGSNMPAGEERGKIHPSPKQTPLIDTQGSSLRRKRPGTFKDRHLMANIKTAFMLFIVTLVFIIAYLPALLMANELVPFKLIAFYVYFIYNVANPFIYAFMNHTFREDLKKLVKVCKR